MREWKSLEEMKNVDIRTVDRDDLVDIRDVVIDRSLPKEERIKSFIKQVGNPYCYKCGDVVVKTSFNEDPNAPSLEDCMYSYIKSKMGII